MCIFCFLVNSVFKAFFAVLELLLDAILYNNIMYIEHASVLVHFDSIISMLILGVRTRNQWNWLPTILTE